MPEPTLTPTDRTRVRRGAGRARSDAGTVTAILDEGLVCHLGVAVDGRPWVFPTAYGRSGDQLYVHGAVGNFGLRALAEGAEACVTVTLLDGLVLARSPFHHSMNYRSVMLFGRAEPVRDEREKDRALTAIVEHLVPGRSPAVRASTAEELRSTLVLRLPIDEASAKVREGGPVDEPADLGLPAWAGVIPLELAAGAPVPDDQDGGDPTTPVPDHVRDWSVRGRHASRD